MHRRCRIESLEKRVFLADTIALRNFGGDTIARFEWQGNQVDAFAGQWLVQLDGYSGYLLDQQRQAADALRRVDNVLTLDRHLGADGLFMVKSPQDMQPSEVVGRLSRLQGFRSITPDYLYMTDLTPNDTFFTSQWGMNNVGQTGGVIDADIDAPEAWNLTTGSADVAVGIIDTGINYTHPDLAPNIWNNPGEIPGNFVDDDANGYVDDVIGWDFFFNTNDPQDQQGHGTHVAGIVGAKGNNAAGVSGVNWDVKLIALKCAAGGGLAHSAIVASFYYVNNLKARPVNQVNVVATNNSYGGSGYDAGLDFIIGQHAGNNILTVAAAGNQNLNIDFNPHYPASYQQPNVIAVANLTKFNTRSFDSNFGPSTVHLAAPGDEIISTWPGGYVFIGGTSMASPHVAGVAALLKAFAPGLTYSAIKNAILTTTDPVPSFSGMTITGGRLNAFAALSAVQIPPTPAQPDLLAIFDTGFSNTDNITNINTPRFQGSGPVGMTVQLFADGLQVGQAVIPGSGVFQVTSSALADGVHQMTMRFTNGANTSPDSPPLAVTIDTAGPQISSFNFNYLTSPHSLAVAFNEEVGWSLGDNDFQVENLDNPAVVPSTGTYNSGNTTQTLTFPGNAVLADADYRLTVFGNGILDVAGNLLTAVVDPTHDFFFMMADADHDRRVNLNDFNILAANFGQSGTNFSQGDFNYDTVTNLSDFNILAARFGNILAAPASRPGPSFGQQTIGSGRASERGGGDPLDDLLA